MIRELLSEEEEGEILDQVPVQVIKVKFEDSCPLNIFNWVDPFSDQSETEFTHENLNKVIYKLRQEKDVFLVSAAIDLLLYYGIKNYIDQRDILSYGLASYFIISSFMGTEPFETKKSLCKRVTKETNCVEMINQAEEKILEFIKGDVLLTPSILSLLHHSDECLSFDLNKLVKAEYEMLQAMIEFTLLPENVDIYEYSPTDRILGVLCEVTNLCKGDDIKKMDKKLRDVIFILSRMNVREPEWPESKVDLVEMFGGMGGPSYKRYLENRMKAETLDIQ